MSLLRELLSLRPNFWVQLKAQLRISECLLRLNAGSLRNDEELEISQTFSLVTSSTDANINEVIEFANILLTAERHYQVILLYNCVCKLHLARSPSDDAVIGVMESFRKIRESTIILIRSSAGMASSIPLSLRLMLARLEELRSINNAKPEIKTENEVICMNNIGMILSSFNKQLEAEVMYEKGLKIMLEKFGQRSYLYFISCALLNNIGLVRLRMNDLESAERHFQQSLDAARLAENFPNEQQKLEWLNSTQGSLQFTRIRMRSYASKNGRGGG